ncbi:exonuclease domain-containing protein [Agrococcus sp. HG114]|uniref:exonuclease domain-containing protein n=1 Tax=Agrococcus sp. HG114 TaxID=2969757 RepID=UPI00215AE285|nr:exonuclease domain-containing protein [Agrococcus sp. HG114]MCR8669691.1 exonuclease domain-containing protein [Agrococcus sp. HG114]
MTETNVQEAAQLHRPILAVSPDAPDRWIDRLAVFDLETTGVDPAEARIVTAYVGLLDASGTVVDGRSWIVDPGIEIPSASTEVHGITTERARAEGAEAAVAVREIRDVLAGHFAAGLAVCAFNAAYDFSLLAAECRRHGIEPLDARPVIDPMVIDRQVDRYRRGKRTLTVATEVYGIELTDAHDASADAIAAGRLAQAMTARYPELRIDPISLHDLTMRWADEQAAGFEEFRRRSDPAFSAGRGWPLRR